nr:immunoglobulin heavy chain junction region [Mus musculus]MBK4185067.1 immunoglobulin heavy chain junction region [Mus musculus]
CARHEGYYPDYW